MFSNGRRFWCLFLQSGAFGVSREGYMLLQFAPSVGTEESIYDWNQKQVTWDSSIDSNT